MHAPMLWKHKRWASSQCLLAGSADCGYQLGFIAWQLQIVKELPGYRTTGLIDFQMNI